MAGFTVHPRSKKREQVRRSLWLLIRQSWPTVILTNRKAASKDLALPGVGKRRQEWGRGVPDSHFNQATLIQRRSGYSLAQSQAGEVTFCPEDPQLVWGSG